MQGNCNGHTKLETESHHQHPMVCQPLLAGSVWLAGSSYPWLQLRQQNWLASSGGEWDYFTLRGKCRWGCFGLRWKMQMRHYSQQKFRLKWNESFQWVSRGFNVSHTWRHSHTHTHTHWCCLCSLCLITAVLLEVHHTEHTHLATRTTTSVLIINYKKIMMSRWSHELNEENISLCKRKTNCFYNAVWRRLVVIGMKLNQLHIVVHQV